MKIMNDSGGRKMQEAEKDLFFTEVKRKRQPSGKVRSAMVWLFVVGAINILAGIFYYLISLQTKIDSLVFFEAVIVGIIFISLSLLAKTKPFTAFLIAIILYSGLIILGVISDPNNFSQGIVIKILVYVALIRGLVVTKNYRNNIDLIDDVDFLEN